MATVARLGSPEIIVYGTFSDGTRQTVPLESAAPLPTGYSLNAGHLNVPAGTYMYEVLHTWSFSGSWSYQSTGSVIVETERVKVVKFTEAGALSVRGITTAGNVAVVRVARIA